SALTDSLYGRGWEKGTGPSFSGVRLRNISPGWSARRRNSESEKYSGGTAVDWRARPSPWFANRRNCETRRDLAAGPFCLCAGSLFALGGLVCSVNPLLVLVEPGDDVQDLGHMMAGPAADPVRLLGHSDQHGVHLQHLEGLVILFGFGYRCPVVFFSCHDHRRRLYVLDDGQERPLLIVLQVIPGKSGKPVLRGERPDIRGQIEAVPVDHRVHGNGGAKAIRAAYHPAGEHPAAAPSCDEQVVGVDVAFRD